VLKRVASLKPNTDPEHQHLLVWVLGSATTREEARQTVRGGVYDIVTDVIRGASFVSIADET
jgi:hypothetical protein